MKDKLLLLAVLSVLAWATFTLHRPGPAPGTLDFRQTNYPDRMLDR